MTPTDLVLQVEREMPEVVHNYEGSWPLNAYAARYVMRKAEWERRRIRKEAVEEDPIAPEAVCYSLGYTPEASRSHASSVPPQDASEAESPSYSDSQSTSRHSSPYVPLTQLATSSARKVCLQAT